MLASFIAFLAAWKAISEVVKSEEIYFLSTIPVIELNLLIIVLLSISNSVPDTSQKELFKNLSLFSTTDGIKLPLPVILKLIIQDNSNV